MRNPTQRDDHKLRLIAVNGGIINHQPKRLEVKIFGFVQGVNFRYHTLKRAQELGLTGFVRNLPEGSVEIVAEGSKESLEEFKVWSRWGPASAQVTALEVEWKKARGEFDKFEIKD